MHLFSNRHPCLRRSEGPASTVNPVLSQNIGAGVVELFFLFVEEGRSSGYVCGDAVVVDFVAFWMRWRGCGVCWRFGGGGVVVEMLFV